MVRKTQVCEKCRGWGGNKNGWGERSESVSFSSENFVDFQMDFEKEACSDIVQTVPLKSVESPAASGKLISQELKSWIIRNAVPHNHVTDLLKTLNKVGIFGLPLSARKLMHLGGERTAIQTMDDGEFIYLGIQNFFNKNSFEFLFNDPKVVVGIGIDGLSLFKSSKKGLWPILGAIVGNPTIKTFMIACYAGRGKAKTVNEFWKQLSEERKFLKENAQQTIRVRKETFLTPFSELPRS